jgi:phthalate 4,5-cis-dihydrodiol dehydrogenase
VPHGSDARDHPPPARPVIRGASDPGPVIRAGVLGLGLAGGSILRSLREVPRVQVVAAADPREAARAAFERDFGGRGFADADQLLTDGGVDAVWIATPSHLHAQHAVLAAQSGLHAVVEKPFATSLAECDMMIDAAARHGTALIAGGARSFDPAFTAMREVLASGRLGAARAVSTWSLTDWVIRAREPYELDPELGGGAIYNQAPHAVDVIRLLGGGLVRSVRALAGDWMAERPGPGYFTALLDFSSGLCGTLTYDGYGYLAGWELLPWGETSTRRQVQQAAYAYRRTLRGGRADETAAREARRFGGAPGPAAGGGDRASGTDRGHGKDHPDTERQARWVPGDAGLVVVSCERGAIRQSAGGLYVYDDTGREDLPLPAGVSFRGNEVAELRAAIEQHTAPVHDGAWGRATMEACLAIAQSAAERREIQLARQVPAQKGA